MLQHLPFLGDASCEGSAQRELVGWSAIWLHFA